MNFDEFLELNEQLNIRGIPGSFIDWFEPQWIDQKTDRFFPKFDLTYNPRQLAREYDWGDARQIMQYLRQLGCKVYIDNTKRGPTEETIEVETPKVPK